VTNATALDVVTAYQDAWTSKDMEKAATYLAPDFVFDGPMTQSTSAAEFMPVLTRFVGRIVPGWKQIAAFGSDDEALIMYDVFLTSGSPCRCADHFTVRDGKLQRETLIFDTFPFRQP
jgi:SnoaL-like domain